MHGHAALYWRLREEALHGNSTREGDTRPRVGYSPDGRFLAEFLEEDVDAILEECVGMIVSDERLEKCIAQLAATAKDSVFTQCGGRHRYETCVDWLITELSGRAALTTASSQMWVDLLTILNALPSQEGGKLSRELCSALLQGFGCSPSDSDSDLSHYLNSDLTFAGTTAVCSLLHKADLPLPRGLPGLLIHRLSEALGGKAETLSGVDIDHLLRNPIFRVVVRSQQLLGPAEVQLLARLLERAKRIVVDGILKRRNEEVLLPDVKKVCELLTMQAQLWDSGANMPSRSDRAFLRCLDRSLKVQTTLGLSLTSDDPRLRISMIRALASIQAPGARPLINSSDFPDLYSFVYTTLIGRAMWAVMADTMTVASATCKPPRHSQGQAPLQPSMRGGPNTLYIRPEIRVGAGSPVRLLDMLLIVRGTLSLVSAVEAYEDTHDFEGFPKALFVMLMRGVHFRWVNVPWEAGGSGGVDPAYGYFMGKLQLWHRQGQGRGSPQSDLAQLRDPEDLLEGFTPQHIPLLEAVVVSLAEAVPGGKHVQRAVVQWCRCLSAEVAGELMGSAEREKVVPSLLQLAALGRGANRLPQGTQRAALGEWRAVLQHDREQTDTSSYPTPAHVAIALHYYPRSLGLEQLEDMLARAVRNGPQAGASEAEVSVIVKALQRPELAKLSSCSGMLAVCRTWHTADRSQGGVSQI